MKEREGERESEVRLVERERSVQAELQFRAIRLNSAKNDRKGRREEGKMSVWV